MLSEDQQLLLKALLCVVALVILIVQICSSSPRQQVLKQYVFSILAMACAIAYFDFGFLHSTSLWPLEKLPQRYVHAHENFHYRLGSKYFDELGYDGLYLASLAAEMGDNPQHAVQPIMRGLHDDRIVSTAELMPYKEDVVQRFSADRWEAFLKDHQHFLKIMSAERLEKARLDHGFNATPTWIFMGKLLSGWLPINQPSLFFLSLVDAVLMAVAFFVVYRTYGLQTLALSLAIFALGYGWRFHWTGGGYLRLDWLAALLIAICLLKQERFTWAGALIGYAAMIRLFPVLLLFGPLVLVVKSLLVTQRLPYWAWPFARGLILSVVVCLALGTLAGRGLGAWQEFGSNIIKHQQTRLTNRVGLENLILYDADVFQRKFVDYSLIEPFSPWKTHLENLKKERWIDYYSLAAIFLLVTAAAAWRESVYGASVLGCVAVFSLLTPTCYYWSLLALVPLQNTKNGATMLLLALNLLFIGVHFLYSSSEQRFGVVSWGLAFFFLAWTLPNVLEAWRESRSTRLPKEHTR